MGISVLMSVYKKEKPEYYNGNGDNFDTIINGNK